jgi:small subunit ribosomal protein S16
MVKIRLRRVGAKKQPSYRVVIADSRYPRNGRYIENIGHYDPLTDPATIVVDEEKALTWLKQGAQPTETVSRLLTTVGIMAKFKPPKTSTETPKETA